jgi:hypothetical protein
VENRERKSSAILPPLSNLRHQKCCPSIKSRRNIRPATNNQWIQCWFRKLLGTTDFYKWWKKTWSTSKRH